MIVTNSRGDHCLTVGGLNVWIGADHLRHPDDVTVQSRAFNDGCVDHRVDWVSPDGAAMIRCFHTGCPT